MEQKEFRAFGDKVYTPVESEAIITEFDDRTKSDQTGYNSIDELATKTKATEVGLEGIKQGKSGGFFQTLAQATQHWIDEDAAGNTPTEDFQFTIKELEEYHVFDATAGSKTRKVGEVLKATNDTTDTSGKVAVMESIVQYVDGGFVSVSNSKNLFNKENITEGYYISLEGVESSNSIYAVSGYIKVTSGQELTKNSYYGSAVYSAFYGSDFNYIDNSASNSQTVTAPSDGYIRVSVLLSAIDTYQLENGDTETSYVEFTELSNKVGNVDLKENSVGTGNIQDESVTPEKTNIFESASLNLYNPSDLDVVEGFYLKSDGTPTQSNAVYKTTGFIPVDEGDVIFGGNNGIALNIRFLYAYDSEKVKVEGGDDSLRESYTVPSGITYIRTSFNYVDNAFYQLNKESLLDYSSFVSDLKVKSKYLVIPNLKKLPDNIVLEKNVVDGAVSSSKLQDGAVSAKKTDFFNASVNLFNPSEATIGYYVNYSNGELLSNSGYNATGYIPVEGSTKYTMSFKNQIAWFDENKVYIPVAVNDTNKTQTSPVNAKFVICSVQVAYFDTFQFELGDEETDYVPFSLTIKPQYIPEITTDTLDLIKENETVFFDNSINLFNINAEDVELGKYVFPDDGTLGSSASYNTTGYIPVNKETNYTVSVKNRMAWFDEDKVYISGSSHLDLDKTQTSPTNAKFVRYTVPVAEWDFFQVVEGNEERPYIPYTYLIKDKYLTKLTDSLPTNVQIMYESALGNDGKRVSQSSLSNGNSITITDFPYHIKKNWSMSMACYFTTLTSYVEFGKGIGEYRGDWIKIDGTNVYWQNYNGSVETTKGTEAHGLTISDFIKATLYVDESSVAYVIVQTLGGYFSTTFDWTYEANYSPFIKTTGQGLTDVTLTCTSKDFKLPVWFFGDSYFGVSTNRWPGVMKEFGFFNFLLDGLAGVTSLQAYDELLRCLEYGTPKYIVWCLGMNDDDSRYQIYLPQVMDICKTRNITLILSTIPTVPERDKETITAIVEASGYRYIDFYKAVGANSSGVWHSGYLDPDQVHPTNLGAEELAMQILIDFPELMQYGLVSTTSEIGEITGDN